MNDQTRAAVTTPRPARVPDAFPGHREDAPLDLPPLTPRLEGQLRDLLVSRDFDAWSEALARVGNCARPVKLRGHSQRIDVATGEILSSYSSAAEPMGVTHVRCGNRRGSVCPACSRRYAADTFHLIRAGIAGGKTVPEAVADNPLVFATLTAPSFRHVHGHRDGRARRPRTRGPRRCEHGRPTTCGIRHDQGDALLGQPLCGECYDYESQVVWQHRPVPIPRSLVDELAQHVAGKQPDDLVFTSARGAPLRNHNFCSRVFAPAATAIGVPRLTPHDLRHTAASLAVQAGANVKAVQRMLGHASAAMTLDVYAGLIGDDLDAVADRLDEAAARARADHVRTQAGSADGLPLDLGGAHGL